MLLSIGLALLLQAPQLQVPPTAPATTVSSKTAQTPEPPVPPIEPGHQKDIDNDEKLGKKYAAEVDKENKPTDDPKMQARVERIGNDLADIANHNKIIALWGDKRFTPLKYHFKVIKGEDVNAFSLPGGYIYVYEGLVKYVESDDELAGVLGHEITHAALRHVATLEKKANQLSLVTLPLILIGILTSGGSGLEAVELGSLLNQAEGSGWSVQAEEAADYGGFQYLMLSKYNPVGMLTFMERLARDEHMRPGVVLGIFRTHPPSAARAEALTKELTDAGVPIRRSEVTTSYRADVRPSEDGLAVIYFNNQRIHGFAGNDALQRADESEAKLNEFFDKVPELFEAKLGADGNIYGRGREIITITDDDAAAAKLSRADLGTQTLKAVRAAMYSYAYRVWTSS